MRWLFAAVLCACGPTPRDESPDAGSVEGPTCTVDLSGVITGAMTTECPPDQACREGECVAACEAFADRPGSIGCEFVVPTPLSLRGYPDNPISQPCHALFVANDSRVPARLELERDGQTFDVTAHTRLPDGTSDPLGWPSASPGGIEPGGVAVIFLSSDPASNYAGIPLTCPITPVLDRSTSPAESGVGAAWRVRSSVPITAYDIMSFGGAPSFSPSASLLLPTQAWSNQYVVIQPPTNNRAGSLALPHWIQAVANAPAEVEITPTTTLAGGGGAPALSPGITTAMQIAETTVAQWSSTLEASGSIITADRPIAVYAGSDHFCYSTETSPGGGCDATHAQLHATATLGSRYVAAPHTTRRADLQPEAIVYRLTGVVDTVLAFDPPLANAPTTLSAGQVVDVTSTTAFSVSSQDANPFAFTQIMAGCQVSSGSRPGGSPPLFDPTRAPCLGDEEWVPLLSPAQFRTSYRFFTDPSYSTTTLTVMREVDEQGVFHDVTVACLGAIAGWLPVDLAGRYQFTTVDLVRSNVGVGACRNGANVASSSAKFGVIVWGTDYASSYGYAAGGDQVRLNNIIL